jgi:hypothetical protein
MVAADAGLVVSELVSNAVMHAGEPICLVVNVGAMLRVEVFDGDNRVDRVVLRQLDKGTLSGRGLRIVNALAESWGTVAHDDGKTVWAELLLPGRGIDTSLSSLVASQARLINEPRPHRVAAGVRSSHDAWPGRPAFS